MVDALRSALNDFYEEQEYKGNSPATLVFYRSTVERFLRQAKVSALDEVTEAAIRKWLVSNRHLSRASLRTYDRALRVVTTWLHRRGYVAESPMKNLPKPASRPTVIVTFTRADVAAMLVEARRRRNPYRDTALIILLLDTGLRIGEVANLTLRDVDWIDAALAVDGKTGPRIVPLGRKAKRALRVYIDRGRIASTSRELHVFLTPDGDALSSQAATQVVRRIAEAAGAKASKLGPHSFRHTFSVEFVRAGGDAFTLQRILGHTTMDMTRRYVQLADSDLRAAHRRFAPADSWV